MLPRPAPPTWRLLELLTPSGLPCAGCGQVHRYLMRMTPIGDCLPVLFPPGVPAPCTIGLDVERHLAAPADHPPGPSERSGYHQVAQRVRTTAIRCEGCGERCEELDADGVHPCEVRYR